LEFVLEEEEEAVDDRSEEQGPSHTGGFGDLTPGPYNGKHLRRRERGVKGGRDERLDMFRSRVVVVVVVVASSGTSCYSLDWKIGSGAIMKDMMRQMSCTTTTTTTTTITTFKKRWADALIPSAATAATTADAGSLLPVVGR